jgi:hypothetical protein
MNSFKEHQMIPLPPEIESLEIDLINRKITGDEASQKIFSIRKKLGPPWHWKSWKSARKKILGTECEKCGAGPEAILYLQHTVKNPRVQPYIDVAKARLRALEPEKDWRPDLRAQMFAIRDDVIPEARDCCPVCQSLSIQFRKGVANWVCNSKSGGQFCGHVFTKPSQKMALTAAQKKALRVQKYLAYRNVVLHREHDVMRQAMLDWIRDWRQYLSLRYTKTLCKGCAYFEDIIDDGSS